MFSPATMTEALNRLGGHRQGADSRRRGVVLVAVLIVVTLLSLAAYHYSDLMLTEYRSADNAQRTAQARALAESAVHYAAALLSDPANYQGRLNNNPFDNPAVFQDIPVEGQDQPVGRFSIIASAASPSSNASQAIRYGVSDESGKINLNALIQRDSKGDQVYDLLLGLPNMTANVAASIADWLDSDSLPREDGGENDYYSTLSSPYRCKNGPLDSLEELLLVKGVTPELLFGSDRNRNGLLDPDEAEGGGALGWSAYLTIYSREQNVDADGQARIYLNGDDLNDLYEKLLAEVGQDMANFILLYRQYGPSSSGSKSFMRTLVSALVNTPSSSGNSTSGSVSSVGRDSLNLRGKSNKTISSLFDLVNTSVTVPGKDRRSPSTVYPSPLNDPGQQRTLLPKLFQKTTPEKNQDIPARVNVNTAPPEVLLAIPNLGDSNADQILAVRPSLTSGATLADPYQTPAWLLTEANIPLDILKKVEKYLTTQTQVYRVQALGQLEGRGATARIEAVIDTNAGRPRILYWRDLTELGMTKQDK